MKTVIVPARRVRGCDVRGCRRPHLAHGLCMTHWMREYRAAVREKKNGAGVILHQRRDEEANGVSSTDPTS